VRSAISQVKQMSLNNAWEVVNEAKGLNSKERFDWKRLIGSSITNLVYANPDSSPLVLFEKIRSSFPLTEEQERRLLINLNSSYTYLRKNRR